MTKLISKIATGIAILGLGAPVLAATGAASAEASQPTKTPQVHQRKHKKLAQADDKTATDKKVSDKKAIDKTASDKTASDKTASDKKAQEKHESHAKTGAAKGAEKTETAPAGGTTTPAK